jgi:ABC-type branched-subunit amino acid transport system substrate-binding protein
MTGRRWVPCLVVALAALLACEGSNGDSIFPSRTPMASPSSSDSLVIGMVGSLSGPDQWRGEDAFEGADVAVQELNQAREGNEAPFELVVRDDRGDQARATRLVRELAGSDRTVGIVYAGPVAGLPDAERALAEAGIPAILCYGDLYGARLLTPHVFQASPSYVWEARRIASYLLRDRRYLRVGALVRDGMPGRVAVSAVRQALRERGGRLTAVQTYPTDDEDLRPQLLRLKRSRVEAIVVEASPATAAHVLDGLQRLRATYRSTGRARIASAANPRQARRHARRWRPQVVGFDLFLAPNVVRARMAGTVASDTYARGAHYLPVPSFRKFLTAFRGWWNSDPLGWERRAYEAVRMIGWAAGRSEEGDDLARILEGMRGERLGGLDVTFGPDDHTSVDQTTVGLWVVPRRGADARELGPLADRLPWVPLARGFSIDGETTDVLPEDWRHLFRGSPPRNRPAPRISRSIFGVTTPRRDPVH